MGQLLAQRGSGGSRLQCVMNRTDGQPDGQPDGRTLFSFWPSETSRELRVLLEEKHSRSVRVLVL